MTVLREAKGASGTAKFRLLMWKNFLQQWRHPFQTIAEVLLPIGTIALVLLLRSQIDPQVKDAAIYPPIHADSLLFSRTILGGGGLNISEISLAYSPKNPILENLLRSALTKLIRKNIGYIIENQANSTIPGLDISPGGIAGTTIIDEIIASLIKIEGYDNSQELKGIYGNEETIRNVIAAVEFHDILYAAETIPTNISYALRFPERPRLNSLFGLGGRSWHTDSVFPSFELPGPRFPFSWEGGNDPGYVNEMFIALQHSISSEIIERITGADLSNFTVNIQRYPHPPYLEDLAVEVLQVLFPMFIVLSFSYTAVNIVRAVTVEKESQLKETMKIMGLPTWLHWTAWFFKQFIYLLLISIAVVVLLKVNFFTNEDGFSEYAAFTNTPWTVLFFYINLYMACTIFFGFMLSGFFSKGNTASLFSGVIWFVSYIPAFLLAMDVKMSTAVQTISCLSINSAMAYGFQLMLAKESTGGIHWGQFLESPSTDSSQFTFGHVVAMLVVDCVLYMLVALYLEQVLPGPFGAPKPWNFVFQKSFCWNSPKLDVLVIADTSEVVKEKDPTNFPVGVKMTNLTKSYGQKVVVNNMNLNIYDGQITILLGHNGAGKSTTISMLTGNVEVTSGSVWVAGYEMGTQTAAARALIGLCPQHNVIFNELTVKEHFEFFARLKGFRGDELKNDIDTLIEKLELQEKENCLSSSLSGGQKRRLCVGIALSGGARVVLLDEPTSGMDPASRRALWDFLQKEKKDRSIILTTHFMDEADILGDRVAIMAHGRLQCIGSPYFLKKHYGVGYTLVIGKDQGFQYELCNDLINKHIPDTPIKEDRGTEITYKLTNNNSDKFEGMLKELEEKKNTVNYKNYGLTATTLEDVFLSVGSDVPVITECDDTTTASDHSLNSEGDLSSLDKLQRGFDDVTGLKLYWQHFQAVWMKLWLVWSRSWMLILLQVVGPLIQIVATLAIFEYVISLSDVIQRRPLTLAEGFTSTNTYLSYNGSSESAIGALAKLAYEAVFDTSGVNTMKLTIVENQTIEEFYLERAIDPSEMGIMRHSVLIGATFEEQVATAWFSNFGYHDVAVSLAAVHTAVLKAFNFEANIDVFNHPLEATYRDETNLQVLVTMLSLQLASGIGSSLGIVSAVFLMFYVKERVSRAKLLQKAASIKPIMMWGSAAIFDWLWFLTICLTLVFAFLAFQVIGLSSVDEIGRVYLCFAVYGAAMLPLNYILSHIFKGPSVGFVITFFINILFGMMGAQIVEALMSPTLTTAHVAHYMDMVLQFFPLYSLVTSVRALNKLGLTKYTCLQACDYLLVIQPNIQECTMETICENVMATCCVRENAHFEWEDPGIGRYLTCMLVTCVVCWTILMLIEYRIFNKIFTCEKKPPPIVEGTLDEDVLVEDKNVEDISKTSLAEHGLVARRISKYYGKHLAVDQVSFTVGDTECFGLLGVNGAGKTTTFKMLMGDENISSGNAHVSGHSVKKNINKVHANIGYCPQFDAVFDELTGRENLKVFSLIRGIRADSIPSMTETLAHSLGFAVHLDKKVNQYSGGNKRKLSTAVSLIGRSRLVFVDEPTSGVDAAAKRQVWRALRAARRAGRGVVLTSHSMEECEALCSTLTIMVNGRFHCYGTPQHLKNKFSQGFTLTIKMSLDDETATASRVTDSVKTYVHSNFQAPKLMEEYQGLLTYYLPDKSMAWSRMFGVMEQAKRELEIEDYRISQTTLEQIFLQFTKYQKEET